MYSEQRLNAKKGHADALPDGDKGMGRALFWGLFAVTLAVYLAMVAWTLPAISAAAGGLAPFDMRPGGYSYDEAKQFLSSLSPQGAEIYHGVQRWLDIAFPALVALTLFFAIRASLPTRLGVWRAVIAAIAFPIAILDYLENVSVAAMLAAGPDQLTPAMVETASRWTVLKSGLTTVVLSALLLVLLWRGGAWLAGWLRTRATPAR